MLHPFSAKACPYPELSRRQQFVSAVLRAAQALADASGDSEAAQVAAFLAAYAVLGIALPSDGIAYVTSPDRAIAFADAIFIVPMLSADVWRLPAGNRWLPFAQYTAHEHVASFLPYNHAIYMSGEVMSSATWQGLKLLHEGLHAYDRIVRRRHMPKPAWRREANAQLLECRVLRGAGGNAFAKWLERQQPQMATAYTRDPVNFRASLPDDELASTALTRAFGSPLSRSEQINRASVLRDCALLYFLEQRFPSEATKRFGDIVRAGFVQ